MFQLSLVTRLGALLLGANLALASSVWAAAPAGDRQHAPPVPKKQSTVKNKPSPVPAARPRAVVPSKGKAPRSIARPFEPVKPSESTGKSLVSHGGPIMSSSDAVHTAQLTPATIGKKPAGARSSITAGKGNEETIPFSQPPLRQGTNPLASRLKDIHIGEQLKLGSPRDLDNGSSQSHSAKGHHDEQKSANAPGRAMQQTSGSHNSTSETGGGRTGSQTRGGSSSGGHDSSTTFFDKHGNLVGVNSNGDISTLYNDGTLEVDKAGGGTDYYHGDWKLAFDKDGHLTMTKVGPPDGLRKVLDPDHSGYYTDGTKVE